MEALKDVLPGAVFTLNGEPGPGRDVCKAGADDAGVSNGFTIIGGGLVITDLPGLGDLAASVVLNFTCATNGEGFTDVTGTALVRAQLTIFDVPLPFVQAIVSYSRVSKELYVDLTYQSVQIRVLAQFDNSAKRAIPKFKLRSFEIRVNGAVDLADPNAFPFVDGVTSNFEESGLLELFGGSPVNGAVFGYEVGEADADGVVTDVLHFMLDGGASFLDMQAKIDAYLNVRRVDSSLAEGNGTGSRLGASLKGANVSLISAELELQVDASSLTLNIPAGGFCGGGLFAANATMLPSDNLPLAGPISISGTLQLKCGNVTNTLQRMVKRDLSLDAIAMREEQNAYIRKHADLRPRYQRSPMDKRQANANTPKPNPKPTNFILNLEAPIIHFSLFDSIVAFSGSLSMNSATKAFEFRGLSQSDGVAFNFTQSPSGFSMTVNGRQSPRMDYDISFLAPGPISFGNVPFAGAAGSSVGSSLDLTRVSVGNVYAMYTRKTFSATQANESFAFSANASVSSGDGGIGVLVAIEARRLKSLATPPLIGPAFRWIGSAYGAVNVYIGEFASLTADLAIASGCSNSTPPTGFTASSTVNGWIANLPGMPGNATLAGTLNTLTPCRTGSPAWNLTAYNATLQVNDFALTILDQPLPSISGSMSYNSRSKALNVEGTITSKSVVFGVSGSFLLVNSSLARRVQNLQVVATINAGANFGLTDLPLTGTTDALSEAEADNLISGNLRFQGQFSYLYTSAFANGRIEDFSVLRALIITPDLEASLNVNFSRFATNLQTPASKWAFAAASLRVTTDYGFVSVHAAGPPCTTPMTATGSLIIPGVQNPINVNGGLTFTCNSTTTNVTGKGQVTRRTITSTLIEVNSTMTFTAFESSWTVLGTLRYLSRAGRKLWRTTIAVGPLFAEVIVSGNGTQSQTNITIGAQNIGFTDLPFGQTIASRVAESIDLTKLRFKGVNVAYTKNGASETFSVVLVYSDSVRDGVLLDARLEGRWRKTAANTPWQSTLLEIRSGLYIDDVDVFIDTRLIFNCNGLGANAPVGITGTFGGGFTGRLPMGIQVGTLNGTMSIPCVNGRANMSAWEMSVGLPELSLPSLSFLPSSFKIPRGTRLTYNKARRSFGIGWSLPIQTGPSEVLQLNLNLSFGKGVSSPLGKTQRNAAGASFGIRFSGTWSTGATPFQGLSVATIVKQFKHLVSEAGLGTSANAESDLWNSFGIPFNIPGGPMQELSRFLQGVTFGLPRIDFDPTTLALNIRGSLNVFGMNTNIMLAAQKTNGRWAIAFGFPIAPQANLGNMPGWMSSIVNFPGIRFKSFFFGLSTGPMTLSIPNDLVLPGIAGLPPMQVSLPSKGFAIAGSLGLNGNDPQIKNLLTKTGKFGQSLQSLASLNLDWAIIVSSNSIALQFGFQLTTTPGCTQPSQMIARAANDLLKRQNYCTGSDMDYTGLALRLSVAIQARPAIQFAFVFDVTRNLGGTRQTFTGGLALNLNSLGATLEGFFAFDGTWRNPLGIAPNLTISHIDLSLALQIPSLVPAKFGMGISASLSAGSLGTAFLSGGLQIDVANVGAAGNGMFGNITNLNLAIMVYGLVPSMSKTPLRAFQSISVASAVFSVVPGTSSITFPNGFVAPAGVSIDIRNINFFDKFQVIRAGFVLSTAPLNPFVSANLVLSVIDLKAVKITSASNNLIGPSASFYFSPLRGYKLSFDGKITFANYAIGVQVETSQDLISGSQSLMIIGTITLWDVATVGLSINTTGTSPSSWSFAIGIWITSNSNQGIIGGLINRVLDSLTSTVNTIANRWKADVARASDVAVASARQTFQNAQNSVNQAQTNLNNDIASARASLDSVSASAQTSLNDARWHGGQCKWYKPWHCVRYVSQSFKANNASSGYYYAEYGVKVAAVAVAQTALDLAGRIGNGVLNAARATLRAAEATVTAAIRAAETVALAVLNGVQSIVNSLADQIRRASNLINLQSIRVSDTLTSSGQMDFSASISVGFLGGAVNTHSLSFSINFRDMIVRFWNNFKSRFLDFVLNLFKDVPALQSYIRQLLGSVQAQQRSMGSIGGYIDEAVFEEPIPAEKFNEATHIHSFLYPSYI